MRCPVTHSARSHQWVPMSAKAREGPPNPALTRQLAVSADSNQSCRYEPWTTWMAPSCPESTRARASCIIVWYLYASGTAAMTPARAAWRDQVVGVKRGRSQGLLAHHVHAVGHDGLGQGAVQMVRGT